MTPQQRIDEIGKLVGKTPMAKITYTCKGKTRTLFAKLEYFNFSGSIKDRMAYHILKKSYSEELLKPGDLIVEATSGNTGIAFAAQGRALGHPVVIFMPDWMSRERISLINSYGAEVRLVSKEEGGFLGSIALAKKMSETHAGVFLPCQFDNVWNSEAHYLTTGPEIWEQLIRTGLRPDAFVAGVGTGGAIMGVGACLKEYSSHIKAHPLEPSNSPTMSTGYCVGKHRIQGISDEFIPSIVQLDRLDEIVEVDDGDSIIMAQKLATTLGLGVGISSGANFLGAVKLQNENPGINVVTVFSDCNKKYLSTDYGKPEPIKEGFLSTGIELVFKEIITF
jgi:cysteine synthase A